MSSQRNAEIARKFLDGATYRELAAEYHVSGPRIQQIVGAQLRNARRERLTLAYNPSDWRKRQGDPA